MLSGQKLKPKFIPEFFGLTEYGVPKKPVNRQACSSDISKVCKKALSAFALAAFKSVGLSIAMLKLLSFGKNCIVKSEFSKKVIVPSGSL